MSAFGFAVEDTQLKETVHQKYCAHPYKKERVRFPRDPRIAFETEHIFILMLRRTDSAGKR